MMVICPHLGCTLDLFDTSLGDLDLEMVSETESESESFYWTSEAM